MLVREASHWWGTILDAADPVELARFYHRLLGWPIIKEGPNWCVIAPEGSTTYLGFQRANGYEPPVWPNTNGGQQMMMHLDLEVGDLEASVQRAVADGATLAGFQPQEKVRVLLDPAGHPFCVYKDEPDGGEPDEG